MPGSRDQPPVTILTGPTAVGKTAVAVELARRMPLRVISADSMQVYRRLDIGAAKPTFQQRSAAYHYCIDLVDPDRLFSVAEYLAAAIPAIQETRAAGDLPLIVGGTRLYLQALTGSFDPGPPPAPALRAKFEEQAEAEGVPAIHARLARIDPAAGSRIHPHDRKRIVRALEVFETTGKTLSQLQEESRRAAPLLDAVVIALVQDREELYRAVEIRTSAMLEEGWIDEVAGLLRDGYGPGLEAIRAHGYREIAAHLKGELPLDEAIAHINRNVRHYVRYQLGWIRQLPNARIIEARGPAAAIAARAQELMI